MNKFIGILMLIFSFGLTLESSGFGCDSNLYFNGCTTWGQITKIEYGGMSNTSVCSPFFYSNFTGRIGNVEASTFGTLKISTTRNDNVFSAWIDYNNDTIFTPDELIADNISPDPTTFVASQRFLVKDSTFMGHHMLRIRSSWNNPIVSPCSQLTYGEAEDYTINVLPPPPCLPNRQLNFVNTGGSFVELDWQYGGGSSVNFEYGPKGFKRGTGNMVYNISTKPFILNGLQSATEYDIFIQDSCGTSGSSYWSSRYSFTTGILANYKESFDNVTQPDLPSIWTGYVKISSTWNAYVETRTGNVSGFAPLSSPNMVELNSYSITDSAMLISPVLSDIHEGGKRIKFDATTTVGQNIYVGTINYNMRGMTFHPIDTFSNIDWQTKEYNLLNYQHPNKRLAILQARMPNQNSSVLIDNFIWENIYDRDIGISDITSPTNPASLGLDSIFVSLKNYGLDTINNGAIGWSMNNGVNNNTSFNNLSIPFNKTNNLFIGVHNFLPGLNNLKAWTKTPNGMSDENIENDTISFVFCNTLSGNYTIGGKSSDFSSLQDAIDVLNSCGVSGPTSFKIENGRYTGTFELSHIPGISESNYVDFHGESRSGVIFTDSIQNSSRSTFLLDSASYITIKNLTINNANTLTGRGIQIQHDCENILIDSIDFNFFNGTSQTTPVVINGSAFNYGTQSKFRDITVSNCMMNGGDYGIYIYGNIDYESRNIKISNNTLTNMNNGFIVANYIDSLTVEKNYSRFSYGNTWNAAIRLLNIENFWVERNEVNTEMIALELNSCNDSALTEGTVINNMLISKQNISLRAFNANYVKVYHNTVMGRASSIAALEWNGGQRIDFRNNILYGNSYYAFDFLNTGFLKFDYNLYYTRGTTLGEFNSQVATNLLDLQAISPIYNKHSISNDVAFVSNSDLRILNDPIVNNVGDSTLGISVDIDGEKRPRANSNKVDIGADEFTIFENDIALVGAKGLKLSCKTSTDTIYAQITNLGLNVVDFSVDSFELNYNMSGASTFTMNQLVNSDTLAPGDTLNIRYNHIFNNTSIGSYQFESYISHTWDSILSNDTIRVTFESKELFNTSNDTNLVVSTDSVQLFAYSPAYENILITEVVQFKTGTGATSPYPSYIPGGDIEIIEISNVSKFQVDASGYKVEVYNTSGMLVNYTLPDGLTLMPQERVTFGFGSGGSSKPANRFYWMGPGGVSSNTPIGYALKDDNENIKDAMATNGFVFPANSGVTSTDWSGTTGSISGFAGVSRIGDDSNTASDWRIPSTSNTMNIGKWNKGLNQDNEALIVWYNDTILIDSASSIWVGPFDQASSGLYAYTAELTTPCGKFIDTVYVDVNIPKIDTGAIDFSIDSFNVEGILCDIAYTPMSIYVNNHGVDSAYSIQVGYSYNSDTVYFSEIFVDSLLPNSTNEFLLEQPFPFTGTGFDTLLIWVLESLDTNRTNDTSMFILENLAIGKAPIASNDTGYCINDIVQSINASGYGLGYIWYDNFGDTLTVGSSYLPQKLVGSHSYFVSQIDSNGCETPTEQVVISVNNPPSASAGMDTWVCQGETRFLSATGGVAYTWSTGANGRTIFVSPTTQTTYVVSVYDAIGCFAMDSVIVAVENNPVLSIPKFGEVCEDAKPFVPSGAKPSGGIYYGDNIEGINYKPGNGQVGRDTIYYYLIDQNGCQATGSNFIVVNKIPSLTLSSFGPFCANDTNILLSHGAPIGGVYTGNGILNDTIFNPIQAGAGTHAMRYTFIDTNACKNYINGSVVVNGLPSVSMSGVSPICEEDTSLQTLPEGTPTGGNYSGTILINGNQFRASDNEPGDYKASYNFTDNNGCENSANVNIRIIAKPDTPSISLKSPDTLISSVEGIIYQWSVNSQTLPGIYNSPRIKAPLSGIYQVIVGNGTCTSENSPDYKYYFSGVLNITETVKINVYPNPIVDFLNIEMLSEETKDFTIEIYDVSGRLTFSKSFNNNVKGLTHSLDLTDFSNGVYNLKLISDSQHYGYKIIKN